jgi:predicted acyltransferase
MVQPQLAPAVGGRLVSLDAFRGATIALMILVNTAGMFREQYAPLRHAEWHGWTITDTVFPSFLWIVGVSIALARPKPVGTILRRGAILFGLGLFLYGVPQFDVSTWRILGVLQRIAICYVAAALIHQWFGVRAQMIWTAALLVVYSVLMAQGGMDVEGNVAHAVDRMMLGAHNYAETKTWDPEGVVSTLPAIATALFGLLAGYLVKSPRVLAERTTWLFLAGNALVVAGLVLNGWMPINKKLWTTSFSVFMAGLDFAALAACLWLIDGRGYQRAARPFVIFGMNAIAMYMLSELGEVLLTMTGWRMAIYNALLAPWMPARNASLVYSLAYTALMFVAAYAMYRRQWFVRV